MTTDAGPETRECPNCGVVYTGGHDCEAKWDWRQWLEDAEEAAHHAARTKTRRLRGPQRDVEAFAPMSPECSSSGSTEAHQVKTKGSII
jgi:hypothetical protein